MTTNTVSEGARAEHNNIEGSTIMKSLLLEAVCFIARFAALVPRSRVNMSHYNGLFPYRVSIRVAAD